MQQSCLLHLSVLWVHRIALSINSAFAFTLSSTTSTGMQISSDSDPIPADKDYPHTEFPNKISQCQLFTAPQFCSHKRLQFESCLPQVQLCSSWFPGKLSALRFTKRWGGDPRGWGWTNHLVRTSFWQLRKTISWQSSPNTWNRQNETWETLATKESSLPRIRVNNWFVRFCFIFLLIKGNCGICQQPKH